MSPRACFHLSALTLLALIAAAGWASATNCTIAIALAPAYLEVPVTATSSASATINGTYGLASLSDERGVINLWANASTGWAVTVNPASRTFEGITQLNRSFNVTFVVPPGESASNIGRVEVVATGRVGGDDCGQSAANVTVAPRAYWGTVSVVPVPPNVELDPSTRTASVSFVITLNTNRLERTTIRLTVGPSPGLEHDAPREVVLDEIGEHSVVGHLVVTFRAVNAEARSYHVIVFGFGPTNERTSAILIQGSALTLTLTKSPMDGGLVWAVGAGSAVSLGAIAWVWKRRHFPKDETP